MHELQDLTSGDTVVETGLPFFLNGSIIVYEKRSGQEKRRPSQRELRAASENCDLEATLAGRPDGEPPW